MLSTAAPCLCAFPLSTLLLNYLDLSLLLLNVVLERAVLNEVLDVFLLLLFPGLDLLDLVFLLLVYSSSLRLLRLIKDLLPVDCASCSSQSFLHGVSVR